VVREFLEAAGVKTDEMFPPYSPDMNLIENVWGLLSTRMAGYDVPKHRSTRIIYSACIIRIATDWSPLSLLTVAIPIIKKNLHYPVLLTFPVYDFHH
jgi:transposase